MSEALSLVMGTSGQRDNPMRPPGEHVRCHMPDHSLITQRSVDQSEQTNNGLLGLCPGYL